MRIRRYYYNENFEMQKKAIKEIVESGLDCIKVFKHSIHYPRLLEEFNNAKDGIHNLRNTYFKQFREIGELDTIIYMMEQQINACAKESDGPD